MNYSMKTNRCAGPTLYSARTEHKETSEIMKRKSGQVGHQDKRKAVNWQEQAITN